MAELRLDLSRVDKDIGQDYEGEEELQDEEEAEDYDPLSMDATSPDDSLTPLEKLDKYFQDEDISKREQAVWFIAEAIHTVSSFSEYQLLLEIAFALANDYEPVIRIGILASIGSLLDRNAELSQQLGGASDEGGVVSEDGLCLDNEERLLDVPIRMLTDINQQVRRVSQTRIISLLEEEKGDREFLVQQLCPTVVRSLSRDENYDLRIDMALFVSRLAALLGKELVLKHFVSLFASLGSDTMFHVRKAFVVHSKDLCPVLGEEATEEFILPMFLRLCRDEVWGVRKTCADMFTNISQCCTLATKHDQLTPAFLKLLHDDSRWVRKAAFQSLGLFISTFYVPESDSNLFDDSVDPLDDSMLLDNSLLESLTSSSQQQPMKTASTTSDESATQRHPIAPSSPLASTTTDSSTSSGTPKADQATSTVGGGGGGGGERASGPIAEPLGEHSNSSTPVHHPNSVLPELLSSGDSLSSTPGATENICTEEEEEGEGESLEHQEPKYGCFQFWRSPIPSLSPALEGGGGGGGGREGLEIEEELQALTLEDVESTEALSSESSPQANGQDGNESKDEIPTSRTESKASSVQQDLSSTSSGVGQVAGVVSPRLIKKKLRFEEEEDENSSASLNHRQGVVGGAVESIEEDLSSKSEEAKTSGGGTSLEEDTATSVASESDQASESDNGRTGTGQGNKITLDPPDAAGPSSQSQQSQESSQEPPAAVASTSSSETQPPIESSTSEEGDLRETVSGGGTAALDSPQEEEEERVKCSVDKVAALASNNNSHPQVRVFVHSTTGQVLEQDLSSVGHEGSGDAGIVGRGGGGSGDAVTVGGGEGGGDTTTAHNQTTTKSMAMDLTLDGLESVGSDPNLMMLAVSQHSDQEVVPDELMELFLSMTDGSKAQSVDIDLPFYCAYSLPGVVLTLGPSHWPLLRPTFDLLASDMQWKIRRVLAYSLHELAKVLGSETASDDLLPVFEEFCTKDIDDVKIGALSHLAEFFEILPEELRCRRLPPVLKGLQDMENEKNWRYRNMFTEQLILLCDLYECPFLQTHVYPLALSFLEDKVAEVRSTAAQLIGILLQKLSETSLDQCRSILQELKSYASHKKWLYRLMYVKQCESFLLDGRISCEVFATDCLPKLLLMARDKVPNVRITVARMLKDSVLSIDYFQTDGKETFSLEELQITLECLQHDADRDVKFFAGGEVVEFPRKIVIPRQPAVHRVRSESLHSQHSSGSGGEEQYHDAADSFEENLYQEGTELLVNLDRGGGGEYSAEEVSVAPP